MWYETQIPARGVHRRKLVMGLNGIVEDLSRYSRFSGVHYTVYGFTETEPKIGIQSGEVFRTGAKYESAVIDKIFLDIDFLSKQEIDGKIVEVFNPELQEKAKRAWFWARDNEYRRKMFFTGGGIHLLIAATGGSSKLYQAVLDLNLRHRFGIDPSIIGDLSQTRRAPWSTNFTTTTTKLTSDGKEQPFVKRRDNWVIPITGDELEKLSYGELRYLSKKERRHGKVFEEGTGVWDFRHARPTIHTPLPTKLSIGEVEKGALLEVLQEFGYGEEVLCPGISRIITKPHANNYERYMVIRYIKDVLCIPYEHAPRVVLAFLNERDGSHSNLEQQYRYVYSGRYKKFNPYRLKLEGICPEGCFECLELM